MQIDESGHHEQSGAVDFTRALRWTVFRTDRDPWIPDGPHLGNPVARDDEVDGALWGGAGPVDDRDPAQDQAVVWPVAFPGRAIGGRPNLLGGGASHEQQQEAEGREQGGEARAHGQREARIITGGSVLSVGPSP